MRTYKHQEMKKNSLEKRFYQVFFTIPLLLFISIIILRMLFLNDLSLSSFLESIYISSIFGIGGFVILVGIPIIVYFFIKIKREGNIFTPTKFIVDKEGLHLYIKEKSTIFSIEEEMIRNIQIGKMNIVRIYTNYRSEWAGEKYKGSDIKSAHGDVFYIHMDQNDKEYLYTFFSDLIT